MHGKLFFAICQALGFPPTFTVVKVGEQLYFFCPPLMYKCNSCCIQKPIKFFFYFATGANVSSHKKNSILSFPYLSNINFAIAVIIVRFQKALLQFGQHTVRNHLAKKKLYLSGRTKIVAALYQQIYYLRAAFRSVHRGHKFP